MQEQQSPGTDPRPDPNGGTGAQPPQPPSPGQPVETKHDAYDNYDRMPPRRNIRRYVIIGLLILLVVSIAVYWFVLRDTSQTNKPKNESSTTTQGVEEEPEQLISTETKHHLATNFSLEFDYPEDWTVTETASTGKLTVRSPKMSLERADGQTVDGQVVLTIRDKQQALPEFDDGNALAALPSEKIAYKQPSGVQRGSTYISFLQYARATDEGLDGIYITGDTGYQKEQAIPKADFVPVDPIISLTFEQCEATCQAGNQPALSLALDAWKNKQLATPLIDILKSLVIV